MRPKHIDSLGDLLKVAYPLLTLTSSALPPVWGLFPKLMKVVPALCHMHNFDEGEARSAQLDRQELVKALATHPEAYHDLSNIPGTPLHYTVARCLNGPGTPELIRKALMTLAHDNPTQPRIYFEVQPQINALERNLDSDALTELGKECGLILQPLIIRSIRSS